jgi:hypothetical protein
MSFLVAVAGRNGAAPAMMTAVAEQQLQGGVPPMVGAIGGLIIGGLEAALMTRRPRRVTLRSSVPCQSFWPLLAQPDTGSNQPSSFRIHG